MKNGDLLAAANEKIRLNNSKEMEPGDKLILGLVLIVIVAVVIGVVVVFWKHKAGF